jgi:hypothetical protein
MAASDLIRIRAGRVEAAAALALYGIYELVRGFGGEDWAAARMHTADIVSLERSLGVFREQAVQSASASVPGLARLLGVLYLTLHFAATIAFLVWVHRRRPDAFAVVRTTLVAATGLALMGYLTFPAAPPRLAGLGFTDTVTQSAGVNLSSDLLGALYNPLAAVPSLHFGYALLVGAGLAALARRRWVRAVGSLYPLLMLYVIVATGNHFFLDAALGGAVVVAGWLVTRPLVPERASAADPVPAYA